MRLYLSSFRMGDHPEHLVSLVGGDGRRRVVIANAMDDAVAVRVMSRAFGPDAVG